MRNIIILVACFLVSCVDEPCVDENTATTNDASFVVMTCRDFDPCTDEVFSAQGGCQYNKKQNGAACLGDNEVGMCQDGLCIVVQHDVESAACADASHECYGDKPYIVDRLEGTCMQQWCNFDEHGRSLRPKPAGAPCVRAKGKGTPEFVVSQCGPCGECL